VEDPCDEIIIIDDSTNSQIADGRFQVLIGFDAEGNEVPVIPSSTVYRRITYPVETTSLRGVSASSSSKYCNPSTGTVWKCYGTLCWDTRKPC
jgi:hypothetical protein